MTLPSASYQPLPFETDQALPLGPLVLGNAVTSERKPTARFIDGTLDEFLLFRRALGAEEITAFRENNVL